METSESGTIGREIRCIYCGCAFEPQALTEMDGDIEYTFFRCAWCGKAYMVSVTDSELRKDIAAYVEMAAQNAEERLTEPGQFAMQKLKESNARRAAELRRLYLKEDAGEGE